MLHESYAEGSSVQPCCLLVLEEKGALHCLIVVLVAPEEPDGLQGSRTGSDCNSTVGKSCRCGDWSSLSAYETPRGLQGEGLLTACAELVLMGAPKSPALNNFLSPACAEWQHQNEGEVLAEIAARKQNHCLLVCGMHGSQPHRSSPMTWTGQVTHERPG